jgi:hypothetical protein
MSVTPFADLEAALNITAGEAFLTLCCVVSGIVLLFLTVAVCLPRLRDDPPRLQQVPRAAFMFCVFVLSAVASAKSIPPVIAEREAAIARICGGIFENVASGALGEITTWNQRLVERECDIDAFVRAANAPAAKLRLH